MLEGAVWRDGKMIFDGFAMNDVVVSRGRPRAWSS
jgi:NAD+ kinase